MALTGDSSNINTLISSGQTSAVWKRGYSAYEIAVQNGFQGTVSEWITSLRGDSITVTDIQDEDLVVAVTFSDGTEIHIPKGGSGTKEFVYIVQSRTDDSGNTVIQFSDGSNITVQKGTDALAPTVQTMPIEDGHQVTFTDINGETTIYLYNGEQGETGPQGERGPQGEKGPQGDDGHQVVLVCDNQGMVYWRYDNEEVLHELVDLDQMAQERFSQEIEENPLVRIVDELPSVLEAEENVVYILREEVE